MEKIKTVLLTDVVTAGNFQKYHDKERIVFTASFTDADELIKRMPSFKESVVVVDMTAGLALDMLNKAVTYLSNERLKFLVVSKNVGDGFRLLSKGALEMLVKKPDYSDEDYISIMCVRIRETESHYHKDNARVVKYKGAAISDKVVLIGSSTGGSESIVGIMKELPENMPPILIVQHMPPVFTKLYADRLNELCKMTVWEASDGDELVPGLALIAPGDFQMRIARRNNKLCVECYKGENVNGHAPSADVLFNSGAAFLGKKAIGVILTGMGQDGAKGLLELRKNGAFTIGQNEESCVVYGMPKVAYDIGAVVQQVHLNDIAKVILKNL